MPKQYPSSGGTEWSYMVTAESISAEPKTFTFEADERQCIDLARRFSIVSIEEAEAVVTLQKVSGGVIHAMGTVRAEITQACAVSLATIPVSIEEEFEGWFADKSANAVSFAKARSERDVKKGQTEIEVLDESVDPEPITNGKLDIGELAAQYISLAIDPYLRAEGVSPVYSVGPKEKEGDGAELRKSPFEALKDWKEKR